MLLKKRLSAVTTATAVTVALITACGSSGRELQNNGVVHSVANAPVAPDGRQTGRITDVVINLDVSAAPDQPGFALREGEQVRITLPTSFRKREELPLLTLFDCISEFPRCDTVVPLVGWPQGALGVPAPLGYELHREGSHTLVITATQDFPAEPPLNPGLKQIHLLLNSFTNPAPASYPINVELVAADSVRHGTGRLDIYSQARPALAVTNAFHENFANGNYQQTTPGSLTDLPLDLLLWNREGSPYLGVFIDGKQMVWDDRVVGRVSIDAPAGATGHEVFSSAPSVLTEAPVTGIAAAHLRAFFRAGTTPGEYRVRFELDGGNTTTQVVRVQ